METYKPKETHAAGFPQKTIIIDSQSAPPLRGVPSEQVYKRMYLMGDSSDIVLHEHNYPISSAYTDYLKNTLNLDLPQFVPVEEANTGTLTGDILQSANTLKYLKQKTNEGYKIQYFNITEDLEATLTYVLDNPTYLQNFEGVMRLGEKTGFREFCHKYDIPVAKGNVCKNSDDIKQTIEMLKGKNLKLKARNGTAGSELGSNVDILAEEVKQYQETGEYDTLISQKIETLNPATFPMVAEEKLNYPHEASIHIFLDANGNIVYKPSIFGQKAEHGSYKGGYYPNALSNNFEEKILKVAEQKIVPALKAEGLTGFHCFDFLYDESSQEFALIEDNTRPGALDFIDHMTRRVINTNFPGADFSWYAENISQKAFGAEKTDFVHVQEALGAYMDPHSDIAKELGGFVMISNPDVLPLGGDLIMTVVMTEQNPDSVAKAEQLHKYFVQVLKSKLGG